MYLEIQSCSWLSIAVQDNLAAFDRYVSFTSSSGRYENLDESGEYGLRVDVTGGLPERPPRPEEMLPEPGAPCT